jgi:nicotinate-nucleotide adenylyltransferase
MAGLMRVGIFGGTFDPPHLGHLILAAEAIDQLKLDRLLWVLTANPPHKQDLAVSPVDQRLELVLAAISGEPRFELSRVDLDRPGPHYAVDTVRLLQSQLPKVDLFYLLGGDSLRDLPLWYKPHLLVQRVAGLGVMRRPGAVIDLSRLNAHLPGILEKVKFIETPMLDISSSEIRQRIAGGRTYRYFLPSCVFEIIHQSHYYETA